MNVIEALRHHVRMRPYDLAVIHPGGAHNYAQLASVVSAAAARLRTEGVEPGMRVAIFVSDPFLHLCLVLASLLNGTVSVSAHPNYDAIPDGAGVDVYLADRELPFATPALRFVTPQWLSDAGREGHPVLAGPGFADPRAVCRLFTSSGTTGTPKVIAHSFAGLRAIAERGLMMEPLSAGPNLSVMWLSTIGGFNTAQSTLWHGCALAMAVTPQLILRFINLYQVKYLRVSPQQLQGLVEFVRGRPVRFPSLVRVEVGGAATPASVVLAARAVFCPNVVGVYGSTEVGLVAQSPSSVLYAQPGAAGYVVPGVEVRIVDEAAAQPVPPGGEGVVEIRAPEMADRYIGDEEATAAGFRDGWFRPGDLGRLDGDGLLHITGRADEMINAGGVKLSPVLVDEFLMTQPGVRDAAAFAFRRPGAYDQVWAAVVCGDGFDEQAVLRSAQEKLNSRAPVRLVRLAEIPRNAMGKPLRQRLSQEALGH